MPESGHRSVTAWGRDLSFIADIRSFVLKDCNRNEHPALPG
jgi:hypothetical protein